MRGDGPVGQVTRRLCGSCYNPRVPNDAPSRNPTFSLARLMAVVTWLAVSFAAIHYLEAGPQWVRHLVILALGLGVVALLVGCLTWVLDAAQSNREPAGRVFLAIVFF